MKDVTCSQLLLSLFTSSDKAQEIEGDLTEQGLRNGKLWYSFQLLLTCAYLAFQQLKNEPGKLLLLSYAVYELVLKLNWILLLPLKRYLHYDLLENSVSPLASQSIINVAASFTLGMVLMRLSARHGFIILLLGSAMMLGRTAILQSPIYALQISLFAVLPGIAGALLMKWTTLGPQKLKPHFPG